MKKLFLTSISLLLCASLFANKVTVSPVKTSYNEIKTGSNGVLKQTVYSSSGMEITVSAELEDENLKYNLELDNITDPGFLQRQDTIKTYIGNFEKNEWTENTNQSFSKNKETATSSSSSNSDSLSAAETLLLAGTACVCAFTLFEICQQTSKSSGSPKARNVTTTTRRPASRAPAVRTPAPKRSPQIAYRGPTFSWIIVDPVIITTTESTRTQRRARPEDYVDPDILEEDERIILQEEEEPVSQRYSGSFYVPAGIGPDYRLRVIVSSDEYIDFYFSRSDRDNVANPLKDRNYGRHSIMFSMGVPDFTRMGGYYIYSGKYVGFYTGFSMQLESWDISPVAEIDAGNSGTIKIKTKAVSPNAIFVEKGNYQDLADYINFNIGLTIKTIPHTWLMVGCGMDMLIDYTYGEVVDYDAGTPITVSNGYLANYAPEIYFVPQIGLNFIFDHIDIATTFQYSFIKGPTMDCMFGIAF